MFVVGTRNRNKVDEILALPAAVGINLQPVIDIGDPPEIKEDGTTCEENAVIKAIRYSLWLKRELGKESPVLAEDSGLMVEALLGWPGALSNRTAESEEERNQLVLERLADQQMRTAEFVAYVALAINGQLINVWRGQVLGRITHAPRGKNGFGYDPIFELPEREQTYAEITTDEKNENSHRTKAWSRALDFMRERYM
jgi:XTP/dITP diphosphohydrolase